MGKKTSPSFILTLPHYCQMIILLVSTNIVFVTHTTIKQYYNKLMIKILESKLNGSNFMEHLKKKIILWILHHLTETVFDQ